MFELFEFPPVFELRFLRRFELPFEFMFMFELMFEFMPPELAFVCPLMLALPPAFAPLSRASASWAMRRCS